MIRIRLVGESCKVYEYKDDEIYLIVAITIRSLWFTMMSGL
jgi:hypothetical protein